MIMFCTSRMGTLFTFIFIGCKNNYSSEIHDILSYTKIFKFLLRRSCVKNKKRGKWENPSIIVPKKENLNLLHLTPTRGLHIYYIFTEFKNEILRN